MPADIKTIILNNKLLDGMNANWRSYHQDCADFALPRKAWQNSIRYTGDRLNFNFLYSSRAILSLQTMAAGFHSNLTNPSTIWHGIEFMDEDINKNRMAQIWIDKSMKKQHAIMGNSNFGNIAQEFYSDYGCFGTGHVMTMKDPVSKVRYMAIPTEQMHIEEDAWGRVIAHYNNFKLSVLQAWREWGPMAGKTVSDLYQDGKYFEMVEFLHYVGPRHKRDVSKKGNLDMEFESVWIAKKDNHLIKESGFTFNPYASGRFWKDANDPMGFSPTMNALADIKTYNAAKKTTLRAAMKNADPPLQLPSRGYVLPLNLNPAAMNYRKPEVSADALQAIGVGAGNYQISKEYMQEIREAIEEAYFVPLFRAFSDITKAMTVLEVQRRIMENMVLLGPVVSRCQHEVLDPVVINTFNILYEEGVFDPVPEFLIGKEWKPVYLSPLAKAQRESEMQPLESFMSLIGNMSAIYPEVKDKVNPDKLVDVVAKIRMVNPEILTQEKEIQTVRQNRAKQIAASQQLDMMHKGAAIAKTGAEAQKHSAQAEAVAA